MKYVINIGRQLGSGGQLIGEKLAKNLNIAYYDKELINLASQESGLGKEFFERADEKTKFGGFLGSLFSGSSSPFGDVFCNESVLKNDSLFQIQSNVILNLAEQKSCVFVGRCADYILRNRPHSLNIFFCADEKDRIMRVMEREKVTEKEAKEILTCIDKKRSAYYNYYTNKVWGMAASYHLCINTSVLGIEETTNFILSFAEKKLMIKK